MLFGLWLNRRHLSDNNNDDDDGDDEGDGDGYCDSSASSGPGSLLQKTRPGHGVGGKIFVLQDSAILTTFLFIPIN